MIDLPPIPIAPTRWALLNAAHRPLRDAVALTEDSGEREQLAELERAIGILRDSLERRP